MVDDPAGSAVLDATVHRAKTAAPATAMANGRGCMPHLGGDHPEALAGALEAPDGRRFGVPTDAVFYPPVGRTVGRVPAWSRSTSALLVLRVVFGLFLASHGYNKVFGGGGLAGTARWFGSLGMRWPQRAGPARRGTEIGAGAAVRPRPADPVRRRRDDRRDGRGRRGRAHRHNGFFIFPRARAGSTRRRSPSPPGPSPRSAPASYSLDHAIGLDWTALDGWIGAVIAGVLGVGGAIVQLAVCYRPAVLRPPTTVIRGNPWRIVLDGRRSSASPRSGSGRCSSPPRRRSTRSATGRGPSGREAICVEADARSGRRSPTCAASTRTTRRWSPSAATSSTGRPTSSSRCSTTSSPSPRPTPRARDLVPQWEADYRTYLEDRRQFADVLRAGDNEPFTETAVDGIPISDKLEASPATTRCPPAPPHTT